MRIIVNPIFKPVFTTKCRYIHLWGGRSRGASHFATDYFLHLITLQDYFRGGFIRSTFGEVKKSLYRAFKDRVVKASNDKEVLYSDFKFNETELTINYKPTGNSIISKGLKKSNLNQAANLKGLEGLTHLIIEEAEDSDEDDVMKLDDTLRTVLVENIQILFLFNPPSKNHYLIKRNYNLVQSAYEGWYDAIPKKNDNLLSIHSTYRNNIDNVSGTTIYNMEMRGKKYLDDGTENSLYNPDFFCRNVLGLVSEGNRGRILTHVKPIPLSLFKEMPYPSFYGLDWGFNDPNAVAELKYHNGKLFVRQIVYKSGMDNEELMIAMRLRGVQSHQKVYYDCARPDNAKTFRKGIEYGPKAMKGFNMIPSLKGADSILYGIRELQNVEIYATEESAELWLEIEEYHWSLDAEKNPTDDPEDEMNHLIDAIRYAYIGECVKRSVPTVGDNDSRVASKLDWIDEVKVGLVHRSDMTDPGDLDDEDIDEFHR